MAVEDWLLVLLVSFVVVGVYRTLFTWANRR